MVTTSAYAPFTMLPVLSAVLGAVFGAAATGLVRFVGERRSDRRERRALMLLIDAEVYDHLRVLRGAQVAKQGLAKHGADSTQYVFPSIKTSDWDATKQRLAHLLPSGYMQSLVIYYMAVEGVSIDASSELLKDQPTNQKLAARVYSIANGADALIPFANEIRRMCERVVGETPEYPEIVMTPGQDTLP
jgi:hypothetical protein